MLSATMQGEARSMAPAPATLQRPRRGVRQAAQRRGAAALHGGGAGAPAGTPRGLAGSAAQQAARSGGAPEGKVEVRSVSCVSSAMVRRGMLSTNAACSGVAAHAVMR